MDKLAQRVLARYRHASLWKGIRGPGGQPWETAFVQRKLNQRSLSDSDKRQLAKILMVPEDLINSDLYLTVEARRPLETRFQHLQSVSALAAVKEIERLVRY